MVKGIVLSGMRPTGKIHLGQLVSVIDNWSSMQEDFDCYYMIANWHALTDREDYSKIPQNTIDMAIDWLSAGIDPQKSTIFLQSLVPEHTELATIFSMVTPVQWLERNPVYRDAINNLKKQETANTGFLLYPLLQTADIASYKATHVPIGEDQEPHLEIARRIIRRFNERMGDFYLPEPESVFMPQGKVLGTDGRKMSKSKGNSIMPGEERDSLEKKVKKLVTDKNKLRFDRTTGIGDPGNPNICSVYTLQTHYATDPNEIYNGCVNGRLACADCKSALISSLYSKLGQFRERQSRYSQNPSEVREIIYEGSKKARAVASRTLGEIKERLHLF